MWLRSGALLLGSGFASLLGVGGLALWTSPLEDDYSSAGDVPLAGGAEVVTGFGVHRPINLTPDPETGIGEWSDGELARAIRHGVGREGKLAVFMGMVARRR